MKTLLELLHDMHELGGREAVVYATRYRTWKWTYRELLERVSGVAARFEEAGVGAGDRVLLWGESRPEWVATFWAALARGITVVPIDFRSSPELVSRIQAQVHAKLLVHGAEVNAVALDVERTSFDALTSQTGALPLRAVDVQPDTIVQILCTSGTTGEPKGVVQRHEHVVTNFGPVRREIRKYLRYARPFQPVRFLDLLPLSHVLGQTMGLFVPVALGGSVVFMDDVRPQAIRNHHPP